MRKFLLLGISAVLVLSCLQPKSNAQTKTKSEEPKGGRTKIINPVVRLSEEPKAMETDSGTVRFLVRGEDTNGAFATMELTEREYATDLHRHNFTDEAYYVLEGILTLFVGGETHKLGAGSYVFIPKGTPHAQGNLEKTPVKVLFTVAPAGFEGFMRDRVELIKVAPRGSAEFRKRVYEIVRKYDLERLGDSPISK